MENLLLGNNNFNLVTNYVGKTFLSINRGSNEEVLVECQSVQGSENGLILYNFAQLVYLKPFTWHILLLNWE